MERRRQIAIWMNIGISAPNSSEVKRTIFHHFPMSQSLCALQSRLCRKQPKCSQRPSGMRLNWSAVQRSQIPSFFLLNSAWLSAKSFLLLYGRMCLCPQIENIWRLLKQYKWEGGDGQPVLLSGNGLQMLERVGGCRGNWAGCSQWSFCAVQSWIWGTNNWSG